MKGCHNNAHTDENMKPAESDAEITWFPMLGRRRNRKKHFVST